MTLYNDIIRALRDKVSQSAKIINGALEPYEDPADYYPAQVTLKGVRLG